jgi:uncharacterized membrane protein
MKRIILLLVTLMSSIFANPTSGWDEESQGSGGGFLGIVVTIMAVAFIFQCIIIIFDKPKEPDLTEIFKDKNKKK